MTMKTDMTSGQKLNALYLEVRRLRARDGVNDDLGGLGFALKVHGHFNGKPNPRVEEALSNLKASHGVSFSLVAEGRVKELPDSGFKARPLMEEGIVDNVAPARIKPPEFQS